MVLIFNPALVTRTVSWVLIFHSLQVYRNRWTEWFRVWADIPAEERDGGVGTAHLASRADARLGQIRLPVRYHRVKYMALLFPALVLKGHICYRVWHLSHQHPVRLWELSLCGNSKECVPSSSPACRDKTNCCLGYCKSWVLKSWSYTTVSNYRKSAQWLFPA